MLGKKGVICCICIDLYYIGWVIPSQLTKHNNSSLPGQSAACSLGFTAVHLSVVHLHVVDPQGAVREQLKTRVLEKNVFF